MPVRLDASHTDFAKDFAALVAGKREVAVDVDRDVAAIIADVVARGDAALADYSLRFDRLDLTKTPMRVSAVIMRIAGISPASG